MSSAWLPVSATEWTASARRLAEPVTIAPTNFITAIPRLARKAATMALRLPSCTWARLAHRSPFEHRGRPRRGPLARSAGGGAAHREDRHGTGGGAGGSGEGRGG